MSFDEIFDLTAGVYFNFYNIYISKHGAIYVHDCSSLLNSQTDSGVAIHEQK